ncbi:NAD-P-binding protein [Dendrothele bispora CBS 962.96]|uniref:NAD-P-binding protein n=1 Tax=Dendrothele bispora (strain CBS 962.96) TaxID=1314807 RepID=A0A4S8LR44_DENBC|nr:NAD-P-binding protein [Dendrothele bispora CBS 962.96]
MSYDFPSLSDIFSFFEQALFIPKPTWSIDKMPDMTGKVVIVTGGSAGIGKITVKALLEKNATVYLAARNEKKSLDVLEEYASLPGKGIFINLDLADLHSVKTAAQEFLRKETKLHVLINNGGIMMTAKDQFSPQGYDLQFATNVLGHFYLTKLLLPTLLSTAQQNQEKVRVITVGSCAQYIMKYKFDLRSFKDTPVRNKQSSMDLYCQSKFGNILFANELAHRYGEKGLISISLNPGNIKNTGLKQHMNGLSLTSLSFWMLQLYEPELGVLNQLYAGTSPECENMNGKYLKPWCQEGMMRPSASDPKTAEQLWKWMEEEVDRFERSLNFSKNPGL